MRVLHIIDSGGVYGAEKVLFDLIIALREIGVDSEIGSLGRSGEKEKPIERECKRLGITYRPIRFSPGFNIIAGHRLLKTIEQAGISLIHAHGYKPDILLGLLLSRRRKTPMVTTVHGRTETRRFSKLYLYQVLDKWSWCFIDKVVAVSDSSPAYSLRRHASNVVTIENGISLTNDEPTEITLEKQNQVSRFCRQRVCVGVVSRLSREKGIPYLVQAIADLASSGMDVGLVIVGDGKDAKSINHQITVLGLTDRVIMTGYVPSASRLIKKFDILVIPSLTEGLPVTLLEAMYQEVPVVATRVGQIPSVLEDGACGIIVDAGDSDAIARGIGLLANNEKYRKHLVVRASKRVIKHYTATGMAERYKSVYAELLAANNIFTGDSDSSK